MTTTDITIKEPDPRLLKYKHAQTLSAAERLKGQVEELESRGLTVVKAAALRYAVPNTYRSAYKQHAPSWVFDGGSREILLTDRRLENRSFGASIPAKFTLEGEADTPEGFRCLSRGEGLTVVLER